jgi:GNAT superfamily N-acetyltransferase
MVVGVSRSNMERSAMIRPVEEHDISAIAALSQQLGYPSVDCRCAERLAALEDDEDHAVFVATTGGVAVEGWIHVFIARRVESDAFAEIGGMVVSATCRGQGIGGRLLKAAERWALKRGVGKLRVRSRSGRVDAHGFFTAHGLTLSKEQKVFDKSMDPGSVLGDR